jgi:O-antigen/teichoic acid export membrane protein
MSTESDGLRRVAAWGAKWTSASAAFAMLGQFVRVAVLAHLLEPRDFGLAATATVVIGIASAFQDGGLSAAIIAKGTTSRAQLSSLYWANFIAGFAVCGLVVASVPFVADFFGEPEVAPLLAMAAAAFAVAPIGQQFQVLLQRDLEFRTPAKVEMTATVAAVVVPIGLALAGAGATAIISGYLASAVIRSLTLAAVGWPRWRPSLRLRRSDLHGYLGFGMYQMGTRMTTYLGSNVDYILIGRFMGPHALGLYSIAYQLVVIPQLRINPIFNKVAFPIYARRRDDDSALRTGLLELTRLISLLAFPLMLGLAIVAPQLVPAVFGAGWADSVPVVQVLCALGALYALANPQGPVFLVKDRADLMFKMNAARLLAIGACLLAAVQSGDLVVVALAYVGVVTVVAVVQEEALKRTIGLSWSALGRALWAPAGMAAAMGSVVAAATVLVAPSLDAVGAVLALQLALGVLAYAALLWTFARADLRQIASMLASRPQARSAAHR